VPRPYQEALPVTGLPEVVTPEAAYNLLQIPPNELVVPDGASLTQMATLPGLAVYAAARPRFPANFTRDTHKTGLLSGNAELLYDQIAYNALHQAKIADAYTGAEPGKMHHEMPGALLVPELGLRTTYNGCDTTAAWLKSVGSLMLLGDANLHTTYRAEASAAIEYIGEHIGSDNLFFEDPQLADGADRFALRVTYWKDSATNTPDGHEPPYPRVYSLAHFQNADALHTFGTAVGSRELVCQGETMMEAGLDKLWASDHLVTAIAGNGEVIDAPSSDSLHSLLYIRPGILPRHYAEDIIKYSGVLKTPAGYMGGVPIQDSQDHNYHTSAGVWPDEQAEVHFGMEMHGLRAYQHIPARVAQFIGGLHRFPELVAPDGTPISNPLQLWVVGGYEYFQNPAGSLYAQAEAARTANAL
jgi:hypothetical protein